MMNVLAPYMCLDTVRIDIEVQSRKRVFETAGLVFETAYGIPHTEAFEALLAREKLGLTTLGHGVQLPHARVDGIDDIALVLLRAKTPVDVEAQDGLPVQLFIFLLAPLEDTEATHQQAHAVCQAATELLLDEHARERLLNARTDVEICEIIHNWEPPVTDTPCACQGTPLPT